MGTFYMILFVILFICIYSIVDYKLGRKRHLASIQPQSYPFRKSNLRIFSHGNDLFQDYFEELKRAKNHIHILFYICNDDGLGREFLSILKNKAKEGVEVRLLLDWIGSREIKKDIIQSIKALGIQFSFANTPSFPFLFYSLQTRNHRKITVIDGKIAYMGGFNVGDEYIDLDPKLSPWRDYHLKITGEGVQDLQTQFLIDWQRGTKENLLYEKKYFPSLPKGEYMQKFFPTEGVELEDCFIELINQAKEYISIGSPYFIPSKRLFKALLQALKRGVKITILVPYTADHFLVQEASYPFLKKFITFGGTVYQYKNGFYHAKILIIDNHFCDLGTANFDNRSLFLNQEINCYIYDQDFIKKVIDIYKKDLQDGEQLLLQDLTSLPITKKAFTLIASAISHFL